MKSTQIIDKLLDGNDLNRAEVRWMMNECMEGRASQSQLAAFLAGLRVKGETVEEISGCAEIMREKSTKIPVNGYEILLDTCGTGGDRSGSFNISTTVALLLASGGYKVAKHGNRLMTSKSGSADVLEALGVNIALSPEQAAQCIEEVGIGFLFAPSLHSAMKHVMPVRKDLKVRTVFNILGPLTNPAGANVQVIGLFKKELVSKVIRVLRELELGARSAYVVAGLDGMDEVSLTANTLVAALDSKSEVSETEFAPEDYGFTKCGMENLAGGSPEENAVITRGILAGKLDGPKRDIVAVNAGFAISAAEQLSLNESFEKAQALISSGKGIETIEKLANLSQSFKS